MDLKMTMKRINEIKSTESELKKQLVSLENEREDIITRLNLCAVFDESLVQIIAELLSVKEEENYTPFMYKSYTSILANGAYSVENDCIGITKKEYLPMFNQAKNKEKLFDQKYGYDMICVNTELLEDEREEADTSVREYNLDNNYSKRLFTFEFLLNEIGTEASAYPVRICKSNFEEYSYIQDYIRYIFDLQVQSSAMRLSYEEMKKAMNDYLELTKKKGKTKKLSLQ